MEDPATGFGLIEGPVRDGRLVFSDVPNEEVQPANLTNFLLRTRICSL